jgi:hypothetical protein
MDSAFNVLEFADAVPGVVYVEGLVGWVYMNRSRDVERYARVFERLCHIALPPRESVELIEKAAVRHKSAAELKA